LLLIIYVYSNLHFQRYAPAINILDHRAQFLKGLMNCFTSEVFYGI
jgi:hypothetical protein